METPIDILQKNLERHVYRLAEDIGERNVQHPEALHAAEDYICQTWQQQGYVVEKQTYLENKLQCSNLEVTLKGNRRPEQFLLVGAHYDSVFGSPGGNDRAWRAVPHALAGNR